MQSIHLTNMMVIHQLPRTQETLWLRILGKGNVQKQAIAELVSLSLDNPLRSNALKLLTNLRANLQSSQNLDKEERELLMELSPLYVQEDALQRGVEQGEQRGMQLMLESMLQVKFGEIDEQLSQVIAPLMQLSALERTQMIMQLSREELVARFGAGN